MNASLIEILDKFLVVIWPMLRLSAFLAFTSIFSIRAVNMRIRICLAFAMAFFVSQQIDIPKIDPVTADGLMEISRQILIGLTLGLVFQVASAALVVAGQAMSGSMGLSMANMVDPNMGSVPVLSQLFNIMGTLIFLGMGGHLIVFGLVMESFKLIPIGQEFFTQDMLAKMINWSAMMFLGALLIALPVMMTLLFTPGPFPVKRRWRRCGGVFGLPPGQSAARPAPNCPSAAGRARRHRGPWRGRRRCRGSGAAGRRAGWR